MIQERRILKVSYGNQKLGPAIPSINLLPAATCRPDAPCSRLCYAKHGRFIFKNVRSTLESNTELWQQDPNSFELQAIGAAVAHRFFRWHSAGDILDLKYLAMMERVANACPGTKFLCFTKKYEIVNDYIRIFGPLRPNLNIVLSAWGQWVPENPYNLPMAYVDLKDGTSEIPKDALKCSGFCGQCVTSNQNCWTLKQGESVCFKQH